MADSAPETGPLLWLGWGQPLLPLSATLLGGAALAVLVEAAAAAVVLVVAVVAAVVLRWRSTLWTMMTTMAIHRPRTKALAEAISLAHCSPGCLSAGEGRSHHHHWMLWLQLPYCVCPLPF